MQSKKLKQLRSIVIVPVAWIAHNHSMSLKRITLYITGGFIIIILAVMVWVVAGFSGTADFSRNYDCAVVFGAAVHGGGEPGPGISRRMDMAVSLYRDGKVKTLFLAGGKGRGMEDSEASVMREVAIESGIPQVDIYMEDESQSTVENLKNVNPLTKDCIRVLGISDRYHLRRIGWLATRLGLDNFDTHPSMRTAPIVFEIKSVVREALAIIYLTFTGIL